MLCSFNEKTRMFSYVKCDLLYFFKSRFMRNQLSNPKNKTTRKNEVSLSNEGSSCWIPRRGKMESENTNIKKCVTYRELKFLCSFSDLVLSLRYRNEIQKTTPAIAVVFLASCFLLLFRERTGKIFDLLYVTHF